MTNRRALFIIACLGLLTFGIVMTTLGAVLPRVIEHFGIGKASAGSLLLLNTFGIVVGSLVFGPVVDRWGYKEMLLVSLGIIVVGMEAIAFAFACGSSSTFWLMGVAMAPGAMLLAFILCGASSTARLRINIRMPPFDAQYGAYCGKGMSS